MKEGSWPSPFCHLCCLPDDSASQPGHQRPPFCEELSYSFNPDPPEGLHPRAQFIPERGEKDPHMHGCTWVTTLE